jgi:hypothetical protein
MPAEKGASLDLQAFLGSTGTDPLLPPTKTKHPLPLASISSLKHQINRNPQYPRRLPLGHPIDPLHPL